VSIATAEKPPQRPKSKQVGVGSKLRKAHAWFEMLAAGVKATAYEARQKKERKNGKKLNADELTQVVDEIETLQRQINTLQNKQDKEKEKLLAHWGYTGVEEIETTLGKTLISPSYQMCVQSDVVREGIGNNLWRKISERVLQPDRLLMEGKENAELRELAADAVKVAKLRMSITPPSSRRPKSAEGEEDEE
jgi:hypothetical protein